MVISVPTALNAWSNELVFENCLDLVECALSDFSELGQCFERKNKSSPNCEMH